MPDQRPVFDGLTSRVARMRKAAGNHRVVRTIGGRGATALLLGTALSIGGLAETLDHVHFLVQKDLDSVRVVRTNGEQQKVVAKLDGFRGNTLFKLSQVLPDRYVSRELALFDNSWIPADQTDIAQAALPQRARDLFFEEMKRINSTIRAEFFASEIPYGELIHEKAEKYDVDPALVAAVIEQESRFRPGAKSQVGARGLMQLMPRTGRWMGASNLYDPAQNIDAGVKYIKYLNGRFNGDLKKTIAAYNAGEGNVDKWIARARAQDKDLDISAIPFGETRSYVTKVLAARQQYRTTYRDELGL